MQPEHGNNLHMVLILESVSPLQDGKTLGRDTMDLHSRISNSRLGRVRTRHAPADHGCRVPELCYLHESGAE